MKATGCVGFAADAGLILHRVIESFSVDPTASETPKGQLWVDMFVENTGDSAGELTIMHRGSLMGETTTRRAWGLQSTCEIRARIEELHREVEVVARRDGSVYFESTQYQIHDRADGDVKAEVGGVEGKDVPFTLYSFSFPPHQHTLVRLKLRMTEPTFNTQIGADALEFYAFGEAILFDRIAEDLEKYMESDKQAYEDSRKQFLARRVLPAVFEYMLVTLAPSTVRWLTTPLTYNFSPQLVPEEYEPKTHWYIARFPHTSDFQVRMENAFVLKAVRDRESDVTKPENEPELVHAGVY